MRAPALSTRRSVRAVVTALSTIAALAGTEDLSAQDRSIFSLLDTEGRSVGPTTMASADGALTPDDVLSAGGRRIQVWTLAADPGAALRIDLRSSDFDAYLYAVGPDLGEGLRDDDGGDGLNARLCVVVGDEGEYRLVASSLGGETGAFTLQVSEEPGVQSGTCPGVPSGGEITDLTALPTDGRVLAVGDEVSGQLGPSDPVLFGSPAQAWLVEGVAGESFAVDLRSDAFDSYLMMHGPGLDPFLEDDDGAGRCDSRIVMTFPESGTYGIVVSSISSNVAGGYMLVTGDTPGGVDPDGCIAPTFDDVDSFTTNTELTEVGSLQIGVQASGAMTGSEGLFQGKYMQSWRLDGRAGDRLSIELRSADFDSYLYFFGPGFSQALFNDDGAGNLHSRLCVELSESGEYTVLSGPLSGAQTGGRFTLDVAREGDGSLCDGYTLSPDALARELAARDTEGRTLSIGEEVTGSMDATAERHPESNYQIQPWRLTVSAGTVVYVDVESEAFDPLIYAVGAGIPGALFVDDAGDGNCNTRVQIGPGVDGDVTLLVGAFFDGSAGDFLLRASTDPPVLASGGCGNNSGGAELGGTQSSADASLLVNLGSGADRPIEVGTEVGGSLDGQALLTSGVPAHAWAVEVVAGESYAIELISDDFDPVLYLDGPGLSGALTDDDGLGNNDSRIVYEAGSSGTMRLTAAAYAPDATGAYRLRVLRLVR